MMTGFLFILGSFHFTAFIYCVQLRIVLSPCGFKPEIGCKHIASRCVVQASPYVKTKPDLPPTFLHFCQSEEEDANIAASQ